MSEFDTRGSRTTRERMSDYLCQFSSYDSFRVASISAFRGPASAVFSVRNPRMSGPGYDDRPALRRLVCTWNAPTCRRARSRAAICPSGWRGVVEQERVEKETAARLHRRQLHIGLVIVLRIDYVIVGHVDVGLRPPLVAAGNDGHAAVLLGGVVKREPAGAEVHRLDRPVG